MIGRSKSRKLLDTPRPVSLRTNRATLTKDNRPSWQRNLDDAKFDMLDNCHTVSDVAYILLNKYVAYIFKENKTPANIKSLLKTLVKTIEGGYNIVSYHCFYHAVDVAQYVNVLLGSENVQKVIQAHEAFYMIFAALCHDIGHFGVGNKEFKTTDKHVGAFLHSPLATNEYPKPSLETYHYSLTKEILYTHPLFQQTTLKENTRSEIKKWCSALIRATDLDLADEYIDTFSTNVPMPNPYIKFLSHDDDDSDLTVEARQPPKVAMLMIKAADLSNALRLLGSSVQWTAKVAEEEKAVLDVSERLRQILQNPAARGSDTARLSNIAQDDNDFSLSIEGLKKEMLLALQKIYVEPDTAALQKNLEEFRAFAIDGPFGLARTAATLLNNEGLGKDLLAAAEDIVAVMGVRR